LSVYFKGFKFYDANFCFNFFLVLLSCLVDSSEVVLQVVCGNEEVFRIR